MDSSKAAYKWDRANTTRIGLKLQNRTDKDILEVLNRIENKQGYIKMLIREDLKRDKNFLYYLKK